MRSNSRRSLRLGISVAVGVVALAAFPTNAVAGPAAHALEREQNSLGESAEFGVLESAAANPDDFWPTPPSESETALPRPGEVFPHTETDVDEPAMVGATRGFDVYNLTAEPLTFTGWDPNRSAPDSGPLVGAVLKPGDSHHFEVTYKVFSVNEVTARYQMIGGATINAGMSVFSVFDSDSWCGGTTCSAGQGKQDIIFMDSPGSVIEVPAGQGQKQSEVLNSLCENDRAKCTFTAKRYEELVQSEQHGVGDVIRNNTSTSAMRMIIVTDNQTTNTSWKVGGKVGLKLFDIASLEASAEYGKSLTRSHTFSQQLSLTIPPGHVSWVTASQPVSRVHGDFTVVMGNTTWKLRDVYLETPNPSGQSVWNIYDAPIHAPSSTGIPEVVTDTNPEDSAAADTSTPAAPGSESSIHVHHVGHEDIPSYVLHQIQVAPEQ